ncbi:UDP-2,3-diacylglucosamine diphosphatase [Hyphobacterium sp. CCMP332]|nr:UDP-2,3-diacylglucosamine diphosphatase [Hyphobacterium sp. CCMP332]
MNKKRRKVELVVISDVHLGTYGSQARELNKYLKSIQPKTLILNGDIVDFWQFSKRYWPNSHMKVVKQVLNMASKGTKVIYITGNHDETLRKFDGLKMGNFRIANQYELKLNGQKTWFFHGDILDFTMQYSPWLARIGAISYDALIILNLSINRIRAFFGKGKVSLSKRIKDNVKSAVSFINSFEQTAAELGIQKKYDLIVCGHIHQPTDKLITDKNGNSVRYLNSGDWVENLSSLEYDKEKWRIYYFNEDDSLDSSEKESLNGEIPDIEELNNKELFQKMLSEFKKF